MKLTEKQETLYIEAQCAAIMFGISPTLLNRLDKLAASINWSNKSDKVKRAMLKCIVQQTLRTARIARV